MRNLLKTKEKIMAQKVNKSKILPADTNFITLHKMNFQRKQTPNKRSKQKLEDPKKQELKGITYYFGCYSPAKSNKSQQCVYRQSFKGAIGLKTKKTRTITRVPRFFTTRSVDFGSSSPKQNHHPNISNKQNKTFLKLEDYDLFAVNGIRKRISSQAYQQPDLQRSYHLGQLLRKRKNSYFQRLNYQKKALKNKFFKDNDFQQSNFEGKIKKIKQKQLAMQSCQFKPWINEPQEQEITHFVRYH